jgi:hypothetical protein
VKVAERLWSNGILSQAAPALLIALLKLTDQSVPTAHFIVPKISCGLDSLNTNHFEH